MKYYLTLWGCFFFIFSIAQKYIPIDSADRPKRENFITIFKNSNTEFIKQLKEKHEGKIKKRLVETQEGFAKEFIQEIKEGQFCFDTRFSNKANEILDELKQKNPIIPKNIKVLVSKNSTLNAYCLPDGTFVVHMGLFYWLNNEDQIAGIISHEIGHKLLEHSIKTQLKNIGDELSETNKKVIQNLKNEKYNKSQKAFELFKSKLYAQRSERKKYEYQADSIGYLLLKNTKYNNLDYIEALRLTEKYDTIKPKGVTIEIYKKLFDLPNQKFKEDWLKKEDFSGYDYTLYKEKLDKDSISTHPETEDRIKKLELLFPELKHSKSNPPTKLFEELERIANLERVPNMYFFEEYGLGIYDCLHYLQEKKDEEYYKEWLGKFFVKIYEGRKRYKLNRYLDQIDAKNHSESYQQFLSFMWNLKLEEIKNIADYYSKNSNIK